MKLLIVDDEKHNIKTLDNLSKRVCDKISAIETASSVKTAKQKIESFEPDVILLDIEMQDGTGFDLLQLFPKPNFVVIFVTGFNQYALEAFKVSALDYLLKPIDSAELKLALDKAYDQKKDKTTELENKINTLFELINQKNAETNGDKKISVSTLEGVIFLDIKDIMRCESSGKYTFIFVHDKPKVVSSKNLKEYEILLENFGFLRVHNSHLINKKYISKYVKSDGGFIVLEDKTEIPISRQKKEEIVELIKEI